MTFFGPRHKVASDAAKIMKVCEQVKEKCLEERTVFIHSRSANSSFNVRRALRDV